MTKKGRQLFGGSNVYPQRKSWLRWYGAPEGLIRPWLRFNLILLCRHERN